jgi:hypothetical protein
MQCTAMHGRNEQGNGVQALRRDDAADAPAGEADADPGHAGHEVLGDDGPQPPEDDGPRLQDLFLRVSACVPACACARVGVSSSVVCW